MCTWEALQQPASAVRAGAFGVAPERLGPSRGARRRRLIPLLLDLVERRAENTARLARRLARLARLRLLAVRTLLVHAAVQLEKQRAGVSQRRREGSEEAGRGPPHLRPRHLARVPLHVVRRGALRAKEVLPLCAGGRGGLVAGGWTAETSAAAGSSRRKRSAVAGAGRTLESRRT